MSETEQNKNVYQTSCLIQNKDGHSSTFTDSLKLVLLHHTPPNTMVLYVLFPPSTHDTAYSMVDPPSLYLFSR
jgi:hypothetical protein